MKKRILQILGGLLLLLIVLAWYNRQTIQRLYHTIHLFDEDVIVQNFQNMDKSYNVTRLEPSPQPFEFPKRLDHGLIEKFTYNGEEYSVSDYFDYTNTEGFLILHRDTIIFEEYYRGLKESTTHISWSVAKSFLSTLLGIAYADGLFDLDKPITDYLPQLKGTGYDGVQIKNILQMSSGVRFNEDYGDFNSDINRFGRTIALGSSLEEFCKSLNNERPPGTYHHYVSIDTQVLGMLLAKVTGVSLTEYLQTQIWNPIGMEYGGEWLTDDLGFELALGGLNVTMRDYAKLGQLYLHQGYFNGQQIVDSTWVKAATTPDAPHLMPGERENSFHLDGYGYQWWIPDNDPGAFFAAGIYSQFIYVQPQKNLVIVKLSADHRFKQDGVVSKHIHLAMFKEMASRFEP
jgi:CubicO group peptidase (beta-lactamase class C family)